MKQEAGPDSASHRRGAASSWLRAARDVRPGCESRVSARGSRPPGQTTAARLRVPQRETNGALTERPNAGTARAEDLARNANGAKQNESSADTGCEEVVGGGKEAREKRCRVVEIEIERGLRASQETMTPQEARTFDDTIAHELRFAVNDIACAKMRSPEMAAYLYPRFDVLRLGSRFQPVLRVQFAWALRAG